MLRNLRAIPASILAVLLLMSGVGLAHDVASEPSAWDVVSVAAAHPALHSSASTLRLDVRQHRRTVASVAVLSPAPAYRLGASAVARPVAYDLDAQRDDQSIEARGYDATAPPRALT